MLLSILAGVLASWSGYYGSHQLLSVTFRFLHISGIVLGGDAGLWTDWQILKIARNEPREKDSALKLLSRAHAYVIPWMIVLGITGVLMTTADLTTFAVSKVFWTKIALVILLVSNGIVLLLLEHRSRQTGIAGIWPALVRVSSISALLWQATLFAGTLLTVAA